MRVSNVEVAVDRNFSLARYSHVVSSSNAAPYIKNHDQRRKKPGEFAHNQAGNMMNCEPRNIESALMKYAGL
jgi:hypothetical protein